MNRLVITITYIITGIMHIIGIHGFKVVCKNIDY